MSGDQIKSNNKTSRSLIRGTDGDIEVMATTNSIPLPQPIPVDEYLRQIRNIKAEVVVESM